MKFTRLVFFHFKLVSSIIKASITFWRGGSLIEYWDVYDAYRNKTNRTVLAGTPLKAGEFHLITHVCIFNQAGELLIQKRQSTKRKWPNKWDVSVGGKVNAGETSQQGAARELKEELNLDIDLTGIRPHFTLNFEHGFDDVFLLEKEVDLSQLSLQSEEVQAVQWASKEEVFALLARDEFISYLPSLVEFIFAMRNQRSYIRG